ncbi:uncharacterized protein ACBR49_016465 [Aulostomus maculatus]
MACLSLAMFEWDGGDVARLVEAKQLEQGSDARVTPTPRELARHCRRRTRGAQETERLTQELLDSFWDLTDTRGVPLLDCGRMEDIWRTQRRHLACIQDPEGVSLSVKVGEVTKAGVKLPVFCCARGSSSLESFHLHQCRFIPGTSASALHFQVYLLEGLVRWNENRGWTGPGVRQIVALRDQDKAPISFAPRHQERLVRGRFQAGSSRHAGTAGVDSVKRSYLGHVEGAAQIPSISRMVEALFVELSYIHPSRAENSPGC